MAYALGVVILFLGIVVSIALHEVGHLVPAKRFGVRVPRYMIGFGPTLFSRRRGETEYGFKAIPLGGYVRMVGMIPPEDEVKPVRVRGWAGRIIADTRALAVEELEPGDQGRAFYQLAWWKKVIIMAGGPVANLLIAVVLLTGIGLAYGAPNTVPTISSVSACVLPVGVDRDCVSTDPVTPASAAGLEPGDRIVALDGNAVEGWLPVREYIRDHPGVEVALTIVRDGAERVVAVTPMEAQREAYDANGAAILDSNGDPVTEAVGYFGVTPSQEIQRQGPLYGALQTGRYLTASAGAILHLPTYVWDAGRAAFGLAERDPNGLISIVGVGRVAGEIAATDELSLGDRLAWLLNLVAGLNIALFAFNMIPLLPLDGGHIAGALWQAVKEGWARWRNRSREGAQLRPRPVDLARMMPATYVMFFLLIVMGTLLIYADIVAPISLG